MKTFNTKEEEYDYLNYLVVHYSDDHSLILAGFHTRKEAEQFIDKFVSSPSSPVYITTRRRYAKLKDI